MPEKSMLDRVACFLGRHDEQPNIELARELAETKNVKGVAEIAAGLDHENPRVVNDSIKVLYEIGNLEPRLIAPFAERFIGLLGSRVNRLVWGGMIALGTIAHLVPGKVFDNIDTVLKAFEKGSVITIDHAVTVLAKTSRAKPKY